MAKKKIGKPVAHSITESLAAPAGPVVAPPPRVPNAAATIRDRIIEFVRVPAGSLIPNPNNARTHPHKQKEALSRLMKKIGYVGAALARKIVDENGTAKYRLIDGHARKELDPNGTIPVLVVDVTDREESELLLSFDRTGELAEWDEDTVVKLMDALGEGQEADEARDAARGIFEGLIAFEQGENSDAGTEDLNSEGGEAAELGVAGTGAWSLREDAIFDAKNAWGLPDLLPEMLAGEDCIPRGVWTKKTEICEGRLVLWGKASSEVDISGSIVAFYVEDEAFERVWGDAVNVAYDFVNRGVKAVVGPDFSVWRDWPLAVQLWSIYKSRWCCRMWQEAGLKIIPSLNWSDEKTHEWAFAGIPEGLEVVACQCRTTGDKEGRELFFKGLAAGVERLGPKNVILYGAAEHPRWFEGKLPKGPEYHRYFSFRTLVGNARDTQTRLHGHRKGVKV